MCQKKLFAVAANFTPTLSPSVLNTFLIQEEDLFKKTTVIFNQNRFKLEEDLGKL